MKMTIQSFACQHADRPAPKKVSCVSFSVQAHLRGSIDREGNLETNFPKRVLHAIKLLRTEASTTHDTHRLCFTDNIADLKIFGLFEAKEWVQNFDHQLRQTWQHDKFLNFKMKAEGTQHDFGMLQLLNQIAFFLGWSLKLELLEMKEE